MTPEQWYFAIGMLLVAIALAASAVKRWPLTTTMLYLLTGWLLGPRWFDLLSIDPIADARLLEWAAELVVIVSLFTAGLKLRLPFRGGHWKAPVRLAFVAMSLTVGMIALIGVLALGLPLGAAILLGALLAPTDPVLASDVQLESATDRDRLRFNLTAEAGLNDGTAFPFVMLGAGLLGLHELGAGGWRWLAIDFIWAVSGGLAIGALLGVGVGRAVLFLRRRRVAGLGSEEFLTLGLIALSYGSALLVHSYGFLAVFAAGLAVRMVERDETDRSDQDGLAAALDSDPEKDPTAAPAHLAESVLGFNSQLERILEVVLVLFIGTMLTGEYLDPAHFWFVPVLLLVVRPIAVVLGLAGLGLAPTRLALISWFGIRGIGSLYYLAFAIGLGLEPEVARPLISITLWVIAVSILAHGISATPLMVRHRPNRSA